MTRDDWPKGAWDSEPDLSIWCDGTTGLGCAIVRNDHFGHLCGYVRVPEDHPLHGIDAGAPVPDAFLHDMQGVMHQPIGKRGIFDVFFAAVKPDDERHPVGLLFDVHGSVTFSGEHRDLSAGWWYGFDCGHAGDFQPGMYAMRRDIRKFMPPDLAAKLAELEERIEAVRDAGIYRETYRDWAYVQGECASLAAQMATLHEAFRLMTVEAQVAARTAIQRAQAIAAGQEGAADL
jgi:hypothetical protein